MKNQQLSRTAGAVFLIIGLAQLAVALAGQRSFLAVALAFIVLGVVFQALARRKSGL